MDPTPDDPLVSVVLVSLLPLLVMGIVIAGMFYWYRVHRPRAHTQEWDSSIKKRKPKSGGLDCSDVCVIMMDDDRSESSSTHANNLNHNTEPLPIELDQLVMRFIMSKRADEDSSLSLNYCCHDRWGRVASLRSTRLS